MEVHAIGKVNNGTAEKSGDSASIAKAILATPAFRETISDVGKRKEFMSGLDLRYNQALKSDNSTMLDVFGTVIKTARNMYQAIDMNGYPKKHSDLSELGGFEKLGEGFKAIG